MKTYQVLLIIVLIIILGGVVFFSGMLDNPTEPQPGDNSEKQEEENEQQEGPGVILNNPSSDDVVSRSFTVSGEANVFEGNVVVEVEDSDGGTVYKTSTIANAPDIGKWGPFEKQIYLPDTLDDGEEIKIKALSYSAKDGSVEYIDS